MRAIITTVPFGLLDPQPLDILHRAGIEIVINPLARRLRASEVKDMISDFDLIIAGTETISEDAILSAKKLKAICRVGIGLDGVDLLTARRCGVAVTYTPEAPSAAVAELSVGLMLDLLRNISHADSGLRRGSWERHFGRRLADSTVGIIGCGRIGSRVINHLLSGFPGVRILVNDIKGSTLLHDMKNVHWLSALEIMENSDIISLHVPLTNNTLGMIGRDELASMQRESFLINTARGGIVDELALKLALEANTIAGAAVDVFQEEPYHGPLIHCHNIILTCHMGSMTRDCRLRMEIEAAEEAARLARGEAFKTPVPDSEYDLQEIRK